MTSPSSESDLGEFYYQQAINAMAKIEQLQTEQEQRRSEEMYQAWQKSQEKAAVANNKTSLRAQGVAVIKTIAKQARRDQEEHLHSPVSNHDFDRTNPVEHLTKQSMEFLQLAAQHGHVPSMIRIGNLELKQAEEQYQSQQQSTTATAQESLQQALDWYQRAGEHGSAEAWYNLGHLLWVGFPANIDETEVEESNDTTSVTSTATATATATGEDILLTPNHAAAMNAFEKAMDLGDADAMYFVGVHLLSLSSDRRGLELVERAADLGHGGAKYYLALFYRNGHAELDIAPCSPEEFVRRLNDAVDAGDHVHALYLRGHCYYHGDDGYTQNYAKACQDFVLAAQAGHAEAAVSAGAMFHQGMGNAVPRDQRRAFELYQLAGELGSLDGWRNVAACYALGEGVPKCMETANYILKTVLKSE